MGTRFLQNNQDLLLKVLILLKNNKIGKKTIKDFDQFRRDFNDTRNAFHVEYPERPDDLTEREDTGDAKCAVTKNPSIPPWA